MIVDIGKTRTSLSINVGQLVLYTSTVSNIGGDMMDEDTLRGWMEDGKPIAIQTIVKALQQRLRVEKKLDLAECLRGRWHNLQAEPGRRRGQRKGGSQVVSAPWTAQHETRKLVLVGNRHQITSPHRWSWFAVKSVRIFSIRFSSGSLHPRNGHYDFLPLMRNSTMFSPTVSASAFCIASFIP